MQVLSERRLALLNRAVVSGRILPLLVASMAVVAVAGALIVDVVSPNSFEDLGDALWWASQTVTTVGYGDVVPATTGGRVVAVFVMFFGVAAVSLVTAVITAVFVSYQQRRLGRDSARHDELLEVLARIEQRLDRIERS
jgi:voltage-gated potassium channel